MTSPLVIPGQVTVETIAAIQAAFASGALDGEALAKATTTQGFSTTTGLQAYNLEAPAKSLFPVLAPLRNRFPRVGSRGGSAVHWKAITAINAAKVKASVAEGVRNSVVSTTTDDKLQAYKSFGLDDSVTFEAQIDGKGFQDNRATSSANLLSAVMVEEEKILAGGNVTDIGAPASLTAADSDASGPFTAATAYRFAVSALTLYGYLNGSTGHGSADASDESDKRQADFTTGSGKTAVTLSWPAVRGAVAYNVFVKAGASASAFYAFTTGQTKITIDSTVLAAIPSSGNVPNSADQTGDALAFDGMIGQIEASGGGGYFKDLGTASSQKLTSDNAGGIVEIDAMLKSLYDNARISPTALLASSQEAGDMGVLVAGAGAGDESGIRLVQQVGADGAISAGLVLTQYRNKYFNGRPIPVITHPYWGPGNINAIAESLPYPNSNVPNPFEVDVALEYTQYDWALAQRKWEFGIYGREALKCYFPAGCGSIVGIQKH